MGERLEKCLNCKFWDGKISEYTDDHCMGHCHRHAPIITVIAPFRHEPAFPFTSGRDWCGDFERQKEQTHG
jgi:hypothetical protein